MGEPLPFFFLGIGWGGLLQKFPLPVAYIIGRILAKRGRDMGGNGNVYFSSILGIQF